MSSENSRSLQANVDEAIDDPRMMWLGSVGADAGQALGAVGDASTAAETGYRSYDMFGFKVTPMDAEEQLELVARQVDARKHCVITYLNLHGLHVLTEDPSMVELHRAGITHVVIDGMPLIALCRLAGIDVTTKHRVTNLDLIWPLLSIASEKGWGVYYVGSTQDVVDRALSAIRDRLPALRICAHHGFIGLDCPDILRDIVDFGTDIVFVGMGTGLQERWIRKNIEHLPPVTVISVGALFEYIAGTVRTPPRWMGRAGLEWLFRLFDDPKRFWRRYLLEPWAVAWALAGKMGRRGADEIAS